MGLIPHRPPPRAPEGYVHRCPPPLDPVLATDPGFAYHGKPKDPDRPRMDSAALFAAPVWALVWLLTLGRLGRPLWRVPERSVVGLRFDYRHGVFPVMPPRTILGEMGYQPAVSVADPANPPRGGSGVPPYASLKGGCRPEQPTKPPTGPAPAPPPRRG